MLSKSQAKAFFVLGTGVCALVFIGLTIDTVSRVPEQTRAQNLTPEVIRGKNLWDYNNCMGCHTLLGEGAYYAPELTKVYERRGEAFITAMLTNPESMYPGERKMVTYHFTDQEKQDLVAFFKWVGEMDLNGFPASPHLAQQASSDAGIVIKSANRPLVFNQMCVACHSLDGQGGKVGPALDGIGSRQNAAFIRKWLEDPLAVKSDARMPKLPLTQQQITELTAFLSQLKERT